jgi:hypothetical protein
MVAYRMLEACRAYQGPFCEADSRLKQALCDVQSQQDYLCIRDLETEREAMGKAHEELALLPYFCMP